MIEKRIKKLWRLADRNVDAMLITSPENVRYLSGFTGTEGTLILTPAEGIFLTDGRYTTQAKQQVAYHRIMVFREKWKKIGTVLKKLRVGVLGVESRNLCLANAQEVVKQAPAVTLQPHARGLDSLRWIKDPAEIAILKQAARIACQSLQQTLPLVVAGVREIEIAAELEYRLKANGGQDIAFQTIVASGYRAAMPHGVASEKRIQKGELVVIDYGVVYQGYASDETCTFVMGKPTKKQQRVYEIVKKAHDRALRAVKPGAAIWKIDRAARGYIEKKGLKRFFTHGTGHGLGLCVHEPPTISLRTRDEIKSGMVFTVEPGLYLPRWGGVRIEDTVVAKPGGYQLITQHDKRLICLDS